jgi:hypothetical protein
VAVPTPREEFAVVDHSVSPGIQKACVWGGVALVVLFAIGIVPVSHIIPPQAPTESGKQVARFFEDHKLGIRIGCTMMMIGLALLAPWGALIAWQSRRMRVHPVVVYGQLVCLAVAVVVVVFIPMAWVVAAYRPGSTSPDVTRTWHDMGWFLYLFTWPPFSVWLVLIGVSIIKDRAPSRIYPRWVAYLNFWTALVFVSAAGVSFFKTGTLDYRGLICMYVPIIMFLTWMIVMSIVMYRAIDRESADAPDGLVDAMTAPPSPPVATDRRSAVPTVAG